MYESEILNAIENIRNERLMRLKYIHNKYHIFKSYAVDDFNCRVVCKNLLNLEADNEIYGLHETLIFALCAWTTAPLDEKHRISCIKYSVNNVYVRLIRKVRKKHPLLEELENFILSLDKINSSFLDELYYPLRGKNNFVKSLKLSNIVKQRSSVERSVRTVVSSIKIAHVLAEMGDPTLHKASQIKIRNLLSDHQFLEGATQRRQDSKTIANHLYNNFDSTPFIYAADSIHTDEDRTLLNDIMLCKPYRLLKKHIEIWFRRAAYVEAEILSRFNAASAYPTLSSGLDVTPMPFAAPVISGPRMDILRNEFAKIIKR